VVAAISGAGLLVAVAKTLHQLLLTTARALTIVLRTPRLITARAQGLSSSNLPPLAQRELSGTPYRRVTTSSRLSCHNTTVRRR
jgi:hypothetical protein